MPTYHVTFERPVVYLSGSLHARQTTTLDVHAPDGQAAIVHALRVTRGESGQVTAALEAEQGDA